MHASDQNTHNVRFIPPAKERGCVFEKVSINFISLSVHDLAIMHATSDEEQAVSTTPAAPPRPRTKATLPAVTDRCEPVAWCGPKTDAFV